MYIDKKMFALFILSVCFYPVRYPIISYDFSICYLELDFSNHFCLLCHVVHQLKFMFACRIYFIVILYIFFNVQCQRVKTVNCFFILNKYN